MNAQSAHSVLLDTCALIYLMDGSLIASAMQAVVFAGLYNGVFISPVSAWEIGLLSQRNLAIRFLPDPKTWFGTALARTTMKLADLTPEIAIESSFLPGVFHRDPADRMLVATARHHGIPIITSDRKILDYAAAGHVAVIPC